MAQAYPNPFNSATTISYTLPRQDQVSLALFDMTGRQVATLVDFRQDAGIHYVHLDAAGLASGVYICRLTANAETRLTKIALIR